MADLIELDDKYRSLSSLRMAYTRFNTVAAVESDEQSATPKPATLKPATLKLAELTKEVHTSDGEADVEDNTMGKQKYRKKPRRASGQGEASSGNLAPSTTAPSDTPKCTQPKGPGSGRRKVSKQTTNQTGVPGGSGMTAGQKEQSEKLHLATDFDDWFSQGQPSKSQSVAVKSLEVNEGKSTKVIVSSQSTGQVKSFGVAKNEQMCFLDAENSQKMVLIKQILAKVVAALEKTTPGSAEREKLNPYISMLGLNKYTLKEICEARDQKFRVVGVKNQPGMDGTELSTFEYEETEEECNLTPEELQKLKEMRDAKVAAANADWPWSKCPPQLLLEAPYFLNRFNDPNPKDRDQVPGHGFFQLPEKNHHCDLFQLAEKNMRNCGLREDNILPQIYSYVFEAHSSASAFARTCQKALNGIAGAAQHWDLTRCDFLGANIKRGVDGDDDEKTPGKLIVVAPHRTRKPVTTEAQLNSLQEMSFGVYQWADRIETLQLHRVPFLRHEVLAHLVPYMRNIKMLGVYRCPLISFMYTDDLLKIVGKAHRIESHKAPCKLDFFPRFHVGPAIQGIPYSHGGYGVTWDNSEIDTRLAIWCSVQRSIRHAKELGIAEFLISKDSAFRQWVEKLCWNVGPTMEAIYNDTYADDPRQLAALFDFPNTGGDKAFLQFKAPFWGESFKCHNCHRDTLGIFYAYDDNLRRRTIVGNRDIKCLSCKLFFHLIQEKDHFKDMERCVTGVWLDNADEAIMYGGRIFGNKTDTTRLWKPDQREKAMKWLREKLEPEASRRQLCLDRAGFKEQVQLRIPVDCKDIAPKITDPKEHNPSNPLKVQAGVSVFVYESDK